VSGIPVPLRIVLTLGDATMRRTIEILATGLVLLAVPHPLAAQFRLERADDGVTVFWNDQLFTRYLVRAGAKPVLWPVIGPTGAEMTRGWPMRAATQDEKQDHVHQRSFWFTHDDVNGCGFWNEGPGHGTIVHREFLELRGGDQAVIATRNAWTAPDGQVLLDDKRRLTFAVQPTFRWIDFDITLTALDGPATFGDTKEGTFGLRVAGPLAVDSQHGGKIVNSHGQTDAAAWGKPAPWVDYSGTLDGKPVGIAILNHPASFRYPTYWHVRTYGLFAANPFGLRQFQGSDQVDGTYVLPPHQSLSLFYRVVLHEGSAETAHVDELFAQYSRTEKKAP
jgi:hypothetical protein